MKCTKTTNLYMMRSY